MKRLFRPSATLFLIAPGLILLLGACGKAGVSGSTNRPKITSAALDRTELPRYESLEMTIRLEAKYSNPFDARQVSLDGTFTGPDGKVMQVPGFWDGESSWRMRFTPSLVGEWHYSLSVKDSRGSGLPMAGTFSVSGSPLHGWLQAGNRVDPGYSARYLVYQDGTPFYGVGHADALNILIAGFTPDQGVGLFDQMKAAGENFVVWWPLYSNSPIGSSYSDYSLPSLKIIDRVVQDAQKKGVFLVFTIWDHPELRDSTHPWGNGKWELNGFHQLGDVNSFFTSAEAWVWQENFYRYIIARWGYSPAIGLWQTVSEINGTNSYDQTNPWHAKVNAYFTANDPYRHPTTASMSGDVDWPEGFKTMDMPQVHIYDFKFGSQNIDAVHAAQVLAHWTSLMWSEQDKPNWVGEFGVPGDTYYPELFHNSIWAALANGAAMTPAEWNSGGSFGEMTPAMNADILRLSQFVSDLPLAKLNPLPLTIISHDPGLRAWGISGREGGLFWVQDFSMEDHSIDAVRQNQSVRRNVQMDIQGLAGGTYTLTPFDTWKGTYAAPFEITCTEGQSCPVTLPALLMDMAYKIDRK